MTSLHPKWNYCKWQWKKDEYKLWMSIFSQTIELQELCNAIIKFGKYSSSKTYWYFAPYYIIVKLYMSCPTSLWIARQWCGLFYYHWWTPSTKQRQAHCYAYWGLSLSLRFMLLLFVIYSRFGVYKSYILKQNTQNSLYGLFSVFSTPMFNVWCIQL